LCQREGINGLCSVRDREELKESLEECVPELTGVKLNEALEEGSAFLERKLHVRWRNTLVNCGVSYEPGLNAVLSQNADRLSPTGREKRNLFVFVETCLL
jgi:predicted sulfurtransferase